MIKLPESFLVSLENVKGFERASFLQVHEEGEQVTSVRINPFKVSGKEDLFLSNSLSEPLQLTPVPWSKYGYYLKHRPSFTFDPLFHAGCYYVQEASSMFLEQALSQQTDLSLPLKVLDLCAAPGGKSTHIQSLLSKESLLVSNEVIRSRSNILVDNIMKWGCSNVIVTNNDPTAFRKLPGYFDVIVVDAPCSGSGLFRRDEEAINEWSLNNVQLCAQRQKRILADALPALKENGLLIYSTCSYSAEEDELNADWLVQEMGMENVRLQINNEWNIIETQSPVTGATGYRFYPDKVKGEGLYISCFRKRSEAGSTKIRSAKTEQAAAQEKNIIKSWIKDGQFILLKVQSDIYALPERFVQDYADLKTVLNVIYFGIKLGQVMKNKLIPDHALALSLILSDEILSVELTYEEAIRYLQRQDLSIKPDSLGWQTVRFKGHNLGWINVLSNRINNYYPKELRILKQSI